MIPPTPRRGELLTIGVFTIALRAAVFLAAVIFGHLSVADVAAKGDTVSYTAWAGAMTGDRPLSSLTDYDRRVFPGYPAMVAVVHKIGIPLPVAALVVTWTSAGVAAGVAGKVLADARVGWAMSCLIPHYWINSTLGMSEAPLLAVVVIAVLASQRDYAMLAGAFFGFAGLIRPMACFAVAGVLVTMIQTRQFNRAIILSVAAGVVLAVGLGIMQHWTGDALLGPRTYAAHPAAYGGHLIVWPFQSLLGVPRREPTSVARLAYVWIHVAITLIACGMVGRRTVFTGKTRPRDTVAGPWLIGNTIVALCVGPPWGFRHFPRFTIPAAPAFFWTVRNVIPRRPVWWVIVAAALFWPTVRGVISSP